MKRVCIDNHVLIWGIREHADPGQEDMIPRTKSFFDDCKKNNIQIMVPSVVLAELLTAIDPKHHAMVHNLIASSFLVPPFDSAASTIFAKLWQSRKDSGAIERIKSELGATRQELKADCMIVATGIAHKADAIYSHDSKLKNFANGAIPVLEIPRVHIQGSFELTKTSAGGA